MSRIGEELQSRFESEQQKAMLNVLFTANWIRTMQTAFFKPYGISPQQYNILRILRGARDRVKMQDVKGRMIDRAPNATRLADKLIAKGLVQRERCVEDGRVIYARISAKGLEVLAGIDRAQKETGEHYLTDLGDADAAALNRILDQWRSGAITSSSPAV